MKNYYLDRIKNNVLMAEISHTSQSMDYFEIYIKQQLELAKVNPLILYWTIAKELK